MNDFIYIKYGGVEIKSILMSHAFMETTNMRCVICGTDGRGAHSADTQWYMVGILEIIKQAYIPVAQTYTL